MQFPVLSRAIVGWFVAVFALAGGGACGRVSVSELVIGLQLANYVPTPVHTAHRMLTLAGVGPEDVVYDLGSGDGRLVALAASAYGARGVGIELDRDLVERSRRNAAAAGVSDLVRFVVGDLMTVDLRGATVVTSYLYPSTMERLRPRLLAQLPAGARIVSHAFAMGDWAPDAVERFLYDAGWPGVVYLWRVPVAGSVSSEG